MQKDDYIALLARQFAEGLTVEETARLDRWLEASPENRALAEQLRLVWQRVGTATAPVPALDVEGDYRRVLARIRAEATPRGRVVPLRALLRVAAAVLFLVAAIGGFRWWSDGQPGPLRREQAQGAEVRLVELPDGSQVWLRANSSVEFPARFARAQRDVSLNGEAYFEVKHSAGQPFRVQTAAGDRVEVLGTGFGILGNTPSQLAVLVRSGRVRFTPAQTTKPVELTERQKAVFDRTAGLVSVASEASLNDLSWQSGGLEFVGTPLHQVVADLERFYQVKIDLQNPQLHNCRHTAPLTKQPIEAVLRSLEITYGLKVGKNPQGVYVLTGGSCR